MADKVIRRLLVALGIKDDKKTVQGLVAVSDATTRLKTNWSELAAVSARFFAGLAAGAGLLAANTVATAQDAEAIQRRSRALALSEREYQRILAAFESFGADGNDVADVFGTLSDRAEDAKGGMQSFVDDFALVGITVDDLKGKDPQGLFRLFADAIASTKDPNKALTASVRILGDDIGNKLLPMLLEGADGLSHLGDEAERLGVVMTDDAVASSADLARSWRQLMQVGKGLLTQLGVAFAPALREVADAVRDWALANSDLIRSRIQDWAERMSLAVKEVGEGIKRLGHFIEQTIGFDNALKAAMATGGLAGAGVFLMRLMPALSAVRGLWVALSVAAAGFGVSLGPVTFVIGAVVLALAGLALAVNDFWVTIQGGDSLMNRFINTWSETDGVLGSVARLFDVSMRSARAVFTIIREGAPLAWAAMGEGLEILKDWLMQFSLVQGAVDLLSMTFAGLEIILNNVAAAFSGALDGYSGFFEAGPLAQLEGAAARLSAVSGGQLATAANVVKNTGGSSVTNNDQSTSSQTFVVHASGMGARDLEAYTGNLSRQAMLPTRGGIR